ncbi:hypothetical protein AB0L10_38515 [Streptomyces flaveolus]|uniref:hypothetical protein n=1 Tax=Streptomyces flaveolus TaxID=67297 RepID=UPI00341E8E4D
MKGIVRSPACGRAALAGARDTGAAGYALVLQRLVEDAPAVWTADVPRVVDALPAPVPHVPDTAEFAARACFALLRFVWRTGGGLAAGLVRPSSPVRTS